MNPRLKERWEKLRWVLRRNPVSVAGMAIFAIYILVAIFAPYIAPHNPAATIIGGTFEPPSARHLMGTNDLGMDVFSRVVWGTRIDLYIALTAMAGAAVLGSFIGAISGFFGGTLDRILMRFLDSQEAIPYLLLAIALATVLGPEIRNLILVLIVANYPVFARQMRAQMLSMREMEFAEAARSIGMSNARIIFRHLVPNCLSPIYVLISLNLGWAVLMSASLGFVGLGVTMPHAEWGLDISRGVRYAISGQWWISVFPGLAIFFFVLGVNLMGDGIQDILDPKRR